MFAPRVPNERVRVCWDNAGKEQYQALLSSSLPLLRHSLACSSSPSLTSVLLRCTNLALCRAAEESFKTVELSKPPPQTKVHVNSSIKTAQISALTAHSTLRSLQNTPSASTASLQLAMNEANKASSALRSTIRSHSAGQARQRDELLQSVLSSDPRKLFKSVRKAKSAGTPSLHMLQVGKNVYTEDAVPDGFFESLLSLKNPDPNIRLSNPAFLSTSTSFLHIVELAKAGPPLPALSTTEAEKILLRLRPDVLDLFSISARHYLAAGSSGVEHFASLLNLVISNINLATLAELNSAWSIMLHKGHGKARSLCRSWRCILTCPLLAKGLDLYVADLGCCWCSYSIHGERK